jgi:hypothetical protein
VCAATTWNPPPGAYLQSIHPMCSIANPKAILVEHSLLQRRLTLVALSWQDNPSRIKVWHSTTNHMWAPLKQIDPKTVDHKTKAQHHNYNTYASVQI